MLRMAPVIHLIVFIYIYNLGCECQFDEDATLRMLRSHLCNSICRAFAALLLPLCSVLCVLTGLYIQFAAGGFPQKSRVGFLRWASDSNQERLFANEGNPICCWRFPPEKSRRFPTVGFRHKSRMIV